MLFDTSPERKTPERWQPTKRGLEVIQNIQTRIASSSPQNPVKDAEYRLVALSALVERTDEEDLEFRALCTLVLQIQNKGPWAPTDSDLKRLEKIRALGTRSKDEVEVLRLSLVSDRTSDDRRKFRALLAKLRTEESNENAEKQLQRALITRDERKERARRLIETGGLIDVAGGRSLDKEVLVGLVMDGLSRLSQNSELWRATGKRVLIERSSR